MNEHVSAYLKQKGYEINSRACAIIQEAGDWYRLKETESHKRPTVNGQIRELVRLGFAKRAAADDANLCEVVSINAGAADELVQSVFRANRFDTQYRKQLEETSAQGTTACYVRLEAAEVLTDGSLQGGEIRLNYINAEGFLPLTVENGEVLEAAFWGERCQGAKKAVTLVICTREKESANYAYETVDFDAAGKHEAPVTVTLGPVKPFAVMQTAEVNSIEGMEGYGFPKVYGSIPLFLALDSAFTALFGDIEKSDAITFINEQLCGFDEKGKPIPPNEAQKKRFVFLGEKLPQKDTLIQTEAPEIRVDQFQKAIEMLLAILSTKFGYGTKKYAFDGAQIQTATQYIGERQDMMQELNKQRFQARQYMEGIIRAVLWFSNTFHKTAFDLEEEIQISFDDSYIESKADRLETCRQDALSGLGGQYTRRSTA